MFYFRLAVYTALFTCLIILAQECQRLQWQIDQMRLDTCSVYDRLYTLETGEDPPEDGE